MGLQRVLFTSTYSSGKNKKNWNELKKLNKNKRRYNVE